MARRMTLTHIMGLGALLCAGSALPAYAGFEMTGSQPQPRAEAPVQPAQIQQEAPMPILPAEPVSSEPLPPPDQVIPVATVSPADPVYIRRQRSIIPLKAPANQPMDTGALLQATVDNAPLAVAPQSPAAPMPAQNGGLVINPYPLQHDVVAKGGMGTPSLDQAMMENAGTLRPVATPGKSGTTGMIARANISSRYGNGPQYLNRDVVSAPSAFTIDSDLTPIPGGEGQPLTSVDRTSIAPPVVISRAPVMPEPAPMPVLSAPSMPAQQNMASGDFAPAVGFGRDLPLPLALSQVVPSDYSYAFANGADLATTVSWQGGKSWDQVLNDMLAPSGMKAVIQGKQVTILKA